MHRRNVAFWLLGLLNNSGYVIMIASAKAISEGSTGVVFLANVLPSMLVKLTAPYWFDHTSYRFKMILAFVCMIFSFDTVAKQLAATTPSLAWSLAGIAFGSVQCGIGEASLLAAAGYLDTNGVGKEISYFSSGTGLAGLFGFLWKYFWTVTVGLSLSTVLWAAQVLAFCYIGIFAFFLDKELRNSMNFEFSQLPKEDDPLELRTLTPGTTIPANQQPDDDRSGFFRDNEVEDTGTSRSDRTVATGSVELSQILSSRPSLTKPVSSMSFLERSQFVLSLWPYIIPLFLVYAAEYSLQAGAWTAIGFPVTSEKARNEFYEFSNWMYQAGVFVSRSSGSLGTVSMGLLWLMPILQVFNAFFFIFVATSEIFYNYWLLIVCFYVGLLGGAVYVHGYKRICADFRHAADQREFSLATTSVAESFGILCASVVGLYIQSCLYQVKGVDGATVSCPIVANDP